LSRVVKTDEGIAWESPAPSSRRMSVIFERDLTPTVNLAAGTVVIPEGQEQTKLSAHPGAEEIYLVLRGEGRFVLGDEEIDVEAGHAIYVGPDVKHRMINSGKGEFEVFFVNTPPVFGRVKGYEDTVAGWRRIR
jgi:mannose-6-phosphate isomerase-like protein (cupin superfamily)